jgi:aldehyde dehydrogenase (NAD+)
MNVMEDPAALVGRLRATVRCHATRPLAWRTEQLTRLRTLLDQNRDALAEAVYEDLAPATSALIACLVPRYFEPDTMAVVQGAVPETTALLAEQFDHIFFTGSGAVGRIVMRAAAQHLTPVTLELGGKSPVFVDAGTDLTTVAQRLAAAKFANAGQTCVAPDYVQADPATARALESALAPAVVELYGPDPAASPAYGRIINERHFDRVAALLDSGRIVLGGRPDRAERYIAPTVLAEVDPLAPVMLEEIFGPFCRLSRWLASTKQSRSSTSATSPWPSTPSPTATPPADAWPSRPPPAPSTSACRSPTCACPAFPSAASGTAAPAATTDDTPWKPSATAKPCSTCRLREPPDRPTAHTQCMI